MITWRRSWRIRGVKVNYVVVLGWHSVVAKWSLINKHLLLLFYNFTQFNVMFSTRWNMIFDYKMLFYLSFINQKLGSNKIIYRNLWYAYNNNTCANEVTANSIGGILTVSNDAFGSSLMLTSTWFKHKFLLKTFKLSW